MRFNRLLRDIQTNVTDVAIGRRYPSNKCLGWREKDKVKGTWGPYQWMDYKTVQQRRTNLGAGFVHLHQKAGVSFSL